MADIKYIDSIKIYNFGDTNYAYLTHTNIKLDTEFRDELF